MASKKLNQAQHEAVVYNDGPLLIIAGAGTGKTTAIAEKIAYLVKEKKVKPSEILAVTFTEKATLEMQERVEELISEGATDVLISTFHGLGQRILENHGLEFGLPNHFKLLNEVETWLLIRRHLAKFDLDYFRPLGNPTKHIHAFVKYFSRCKDELIEPKQYIEYARQLALKTKQQTENAEAEADIMDDKKITELANAYNTYNQILLENDSLDFADLIYYTDKLLEARPNILRKLQSRWKYILVDEFQDTNWAQYQLIKLLCRGREDTVCLTVVGDDDQSIYKFRGASVSNILQFSTDFPKTKQIVLNENYRSGQKILDYAHKFIQLNNPDRLEARLNLNKRLLAKGGVGESSIELMVAQTATDEAEMILEKIVELKKVASDMNWSDFAILVRANNIVEQLLPAFLKFGVPYNAPVASGLFRQKIVLDSMAALKMVDNYHESKAVYRLLTCPVYALSYEDLSLLTHEANKRTISLYEVVKLGVEGTVKLSESGQEKVVRFIANVDALTKDAHSEPAIKVLYNFLEKSGYLRYLTVNLEKNQNEIFALQSLFDHLEKFHQENVDSSVSAWLKYFDYVVEAGEEGEDKSIVQIDGVQISTIHKAKGLEFDHVFIPNMVELKFPSVNRRDALDIPEELLQEKIAVEGDPHLEEERRLFYVALTRAKKTVWLTGAKDYGGAREKKLSRFVGEMEATNEISWERKVFGKDLKAVINHHSAPVKNAERIIGDNNQFSFSQIAAYRSCPWQYRYQFVLRIPTLGKGVFSFGKTLHHTLQKFYDKVKGINTDENGVVAMGKAIVMPTLDELFNLYEENWLDDWFYSADGKADYKKKGREILKVFYERNEKIGWVVPFELESTFRFRVGKYYFKGQIDRMEMMAGGQSVKILDYKTGKPKDKLSFDEKLQLLIYQWAANRLGEEWQWGRVGELAYYYLENNTELPFLGTEKDLDKVESTVLEVIEKIIAGDFTPTPDQNTCSHCDFKEICDHRL